MIKWGIIGAGNIARRFAEGLLLDKDSVLYAAGGRSMEKLKKFTETYPAEKLYTSFDELLADPQVDAVYIALPHGMHCEWTCRALEAGKAVLCEKPAAMSEAEVRKMTETAAANNVLFMEAMKCRFLPAYIQLKKEIGEGLIGEIKEVEASFCFEMPKEAYGNTYHTRSPEGGALADTGCYCLSWICDYLKGEYTVEKTYANLWQNIETYVQSSLRFENGKGIVEAGFDRKKYGAVLRGEYGEVRLANVQRPDGYILVKDGIEKTVEIPYENDFLCEISHFTELLKAGKKESDLMPFADSVRIAAVSDAVRRSFTEYDMADLAVLEKQEEMLRYDTFGRKEAEELGKILIETDSDYDRGIVVDIVSEENGEVLFRQIMPDKSEKNLVYTDMKRKAMLKCGHSSVWSYVASRIPETGYTDVMSGGAFPIRLKDGTHTASVLVSGLHEGKDHEIIIRAVSRQLGIDDVPVFRKALI